MVSFAENANVKNEYFTRLELDDEDGNEFTDRWNTGELLCLASAVQRSGDKNWVSVSRSIKPFSEPRRPPDWYTPKNCALQYSKLLKGVEDFKKKSLPRTERETSEELLVKNLTDKRITELNWLNQQTKVIANSMKVYMEMFESGENDELLDDLTRQIDEQEKKEDEDFKEWIIKRESLNAAKRLNKCRIPLSKGKAPSRNLDVKRKNSPNPEHFEDISMHSVLSDASIKTEIESDSETPVNSKPIAIKQELPDVVSSTISTLFEGSKASTVVPSPSVPTTPTSPLLTSLLRSVPSSNASSPVVSYANSPLKEVKTESPSQSSPGTADNTRKAEVFLSPTKTVTASVSPLLTSLLKSPTSAAPTSTSMASHCKEADAIDNKNIEIDMAALIAKSQETSPRSSVSHSPRPTPASSPLLNSLLKSSPSSVSSSLSSLQLPPTKETSSSKVGSSPQPFFSPTNVLATAAAQQLAAATSSFSTSHIFFPQDTSESPKKSIPSSTATSACLSAPTLSKLLEMPPSTPGRLPPLPVVETPTVLSSVSEQVVAQSPTKIPTATMLLNELELQLSSAASPSKIPTEIISSNEIATISNVTEQKEIIFDNILSTETKPVLDSSNVDTESLINEPPVPFKRTPEIDSTTQKNVDILEAVCESYKSMPLEKKENKELSNSDANSLLDKTENDITEEHLDIEHKMMKADKGIPEEMLEEDVDIEKLISSNIGFDEKVFTSEDISIPSDINIFEDDKLKSDVESDNPPMTISHSSETISDNIEEDKLSGRKFYKSRSVAKKQMPSEEDMEKSTEIASPLKQGTKRPLKSGKNENETLSQVPVNEQLLLAAKEAEEATLHKTPDRSPTKPEVRSSPTKPELRSPVAKKPRLFEKVAVKEIKKEEKKELSEDEAPTVRRPGRRAKKGRRGARSTPVKHEEPKDQYEFSESTEENSVGYLTTSTLCYMPRLKEDRHEEERRRQTQSSESSSAVISTTPEKKHGTPAKKSSRIPSQSSAQKSLFTSDEERMSDSMTSDDASSSHCDEDKLKKWKDFSEKKEEDSTKLPKATKTVETPKKKMQHTKRNLFSSKNDSPKKDKKTVLSDVEESSVCSRDSEDAAPATAWQREEAEILETRNTSSAVTNDLEMEANDSHMSSSMTVESDTKMDEMEGYESLQGSAMAEFSPVNQTDLKEEKDLSQFGKQDWYHGVSPKSSEAVSQSSENESEYESDNWDNQSVSTNKSASHSAGPSSKPKRKERESPQYKAWKKAISIVLREASCHKYANVFLQKVTNDVAPGYLNIVYRPMDLSLLKKNVDNGVVKTTAEVHRDMLLMFQNAIMYNSSDHDVHKMAVEMQRDVIQQIQAFLTTQYNDKDESNELTSLRGARAKAQKYGSTSKSKEESHEKE